MYEVGEITARSYLLLAARTLKVYIIVIGPTDKFHAQSKIRVRGILYLGIRQAIPNSESLREKVTDEGQVSTPITS